MRECRRRPRARKGARPGEEIRVETVDGGRLGASGAFEGYADGRLVMTDVFDNVQLFGPSDVKRIWFNRPEPAMKGAAWGAGGGAILGFFFGMLPLEGRTEAESWATLVGATFAGAVAGAIIRDSRPVLTYEIGRPPGASAGGTRLDVDPVTLATSIDELSDAVPPGARLRVRRQDRTAVEGAYAGAEDRELLIRTGDGVERLKEAEILSVTRRTSRHPSARKGALLGGLVGGVLAGLMVAVERAPPEDYPNPTTLVGGAVATMTCAGIGAVATRFMGRHERVVMVGAQRGNVGDRRTDTNASVK